MIVDSDAISLFSGYMQVTGVPRLTFPEGGDPRLHGKILGVVNGSSWISLWTTYFGRLILPEVRLVQVGNEGVQLNFMEAHRRGRECPPRSNIDLFVRYAQDLHTLAGVDAILISCSTMNRSAEAVRAAMRPHGVPVVQIDEAMMEEAAIRGGRILVVATHGPTVTSTQALLAETAERLEVNVDFAGATVEEAFECLGQGDIARHNAIIAGAIRESLAEYGGPERRGGLRSVVLAQLSMSVFTLTFPDCEAEFGLPVLNSGETGFRRTRRLLLGEEGEIGIHK